MKGNQPLSERAKTNGTGCARFGLAGIGLLFALVGLGMLFYFAIIPAYKKQAAIDWPATECQINQAKLVEHPGEDSTSYSIDFRYTFSVDGRLYSGTRYSFVDGTGSRGMATAQQREFPAGSTGECFYNPVDPRECVLDRTNSNQSWVSVFVPVVFAVVGSAFFFVGLFGLGIKPGGGSIRKPAAPAGSKMKPVPLNVNLTGGAANEYSLDADKLDAQWLPPRKLKPETTRLGMFIGLSIFSLFWNGILSVFFLVPDGPFQGGGFMAVGFLLFMIPFLLVGAGTIFGVAYYFLAMFNPRVEIAMSTGAVPLGGQFDVAWEVEGKIERIKKLTIEVEAIQLATYQRGTDTTTDTEVFELLPVAEIDDPVAIAFGSEGVTIPANSIHTFDAPRNKIKWKIVVRGEIPWAPDIHEEFEFRVSPNSDTKFDQR